VFYALNNHNNCDTDVNGVFCDFKLLQNSDVSLLTGMLNAGGVCKNCIFQLAQSSAAQTQYR